MNKEPSKPKELFPDWIKDWYVAFSTPVMRLFSASQINPNAFTTLTFLFSLLSAYAFLGGHIHLGGIFILISGFFDIVDGAVARETNRVTKFGAFYDSTLNRYSEMAIFLGILFYYLKEGYHYNHPIFLAVCLAICGSFMVNYVKARSEGLGFECTGGIMQKPERMVLLGLGALFHEFFLSCALIIIAVLSNLTAIQKILYIQEVSKDNEQ